MTAGKPVAGGRGNRAEAWIAMAVVVLCIVYAGVLVAGLLTLPSPSHPVQDPWFTAMELLILAIAPAMVALTAVMQASASPSRKGFGIAAVAFMSMCAVVTCIVHFSILTLSREPAMLAQPWSAAVFAFRWPSVAYALDILAWDFLFPLAALCAAATVQGTGRRRWVRWLLYASAVLASIGLLGIPLDDMNVRNIGIIGYLVTFPLASALLARGPEVRR